MRSDITIINDKEHVTIKKASVILGLKVRTIRSWIIKKKLKAVKKGSSWFIPTEEIYSKEIQEYADKGREHSERIKKGKEMGVLHEAGQDSQEPVQRKEC